MSPKGRTTGEPKEVRLEIRLSERHNEMLEYCVEVYRSSKGEIIRKGVEIMHAKADREKELREMYEDRQERRETAEKEREEMVYEEAYEQAYEEAYEERYTELIIDTDYTPKEAEDGAKEYAEEHAKLVASETVKDFWKS